MTYYSYSLFVWTSGSVNGLNGRYFKRRVIRPVLATGSSISWTAIVAVPFLQYSAGILSHLKPRVPVLADTLGLP
jgi:hypothetical protein